jgi:hypothetical protein
MVKFIIPQPLNSMQFGKIQFIPVMPNHELNFHWLELIEGRGNDLLGNITFEINNGTKMILFSLLAPVPVGYTFEPKLNGIAS